MECDICGSSKDLVKVKAEDNETIYLCQACYETQYEGFEKVAAQEPDDEEEEDDDEYFGEDEDDDSDEELIDDSDETDEKS